MHLSLSFPYFTCDASPPTVHAAHTNHLPTAVTWRTQERGGFVWLFFGSKSLPADERPPIPVVPELEDLNWRAVYGRCN